MTVVRPAEPADAERLVELSRAVALEPGGWLLGGEAQRSVADERRFLRAVRRHADARVFVAVVGDRVVARLSVARDPHPASRHVADVGLLVDADHRRQGVGRLLLEEAVRWAGSAGVRKLELHVFPWNEPALGLYTSFGFVREGYRVGHYRRDGVDVDAILMALHLDRVG
ncbi:MAG: GNAT family N-acetyltransferase [Gaiella sp.]